MAAAWSTAHPQLTEGQKIILHGHEDLFAFFDLKGVQKKYQKDLAPTFSEYVEHLPGTRTLVDAAATSTAMGNLLPPAKTSSFVAPIKDTLIASFAHNDPPTQFSSRLPTAASMNKAFAFTQATPLGLLDRSQPLPEAERKKQKKKEKKELKRKLKEETPAEEKGADHDQKRRKLGSTPVTVTEESKEGNKLSVKFVLKR